MGQTWSNNPGKTMWRSGNPCGNNHASQQTRDLRGIVHFSEVSPSQVAVHKLLVDAGSSRSPKSPQKMAIHLKRCGCPMFCPGLAIVTFVIGMPIWEVASGGTADLCRGQVRWSWSVTGWQVNVLGGFVCWQTEGLVYYTGGFWCQINLPGLPARGSDMTCL